MEPKSHRLPGEQRKEGILKASLPLFAERGFDAVTTKEIAEAAGISEALLYRHFASKHDLYDSILQNCVVNSGEDASRVEALPDSTSTLVLAVWVMLAKIQRCRDVGQKRDDDVPRLIVRSLLGDGSFARKFIQSSSEVWVNKLGRCVTAAIASGDLVDAFEESNLALWFCYHLSAAINFFLLPAEAVIDYPGGNDRMWLFDRSAVFCLRGIGLTPAAIKLHYNPKAFSLMTSGLLCPTL